MTQQIRLTRYSLVGVAAVALTAFAGACGRGEPMQSAATVAPPLVGTLYTVRDTLVQGSVEAAGVAGPLQQATLSTKLMGTVLAVLVREGEPVAAGQPLVRIDARDLAAKGVQAAAAVAGAEAMHTDAETQANRIRALYADSAATRAQLDAAEMGLVRASAGVRSARAATAELGAVSSYSVIRAPFAGIITRRFVDAGAFAAPGAPLVSIQDASQLRVSVNVTPDAARTIRRGRSLAALIENRPYTAVVEGVIPATAGNLYTINALVSNPGWTILAGSTASLSLPSGERKVLVVPVNAVKREGDLTGVTLRTARGDELRWVRLGSASGGMIEVSAGLRAGDRVVVPGGSSTLAERI